MLQNGKGLNSLRSQKKSFELKSCVGICESGVYDFAKDICDLEPAVINFVYVLEMVERPFRGCGVSIHCRGGCYMYVCDIAN